MRRRVSRWAVLAGSATFAASVATARAQTARTPLTVLLTTTADSVPFFYAQQQALFEKAGLDVTATFVTSGSIAVAAVIGGSAQIGNTNVFTAMQAHVRGIPLMLIAPSGQHDPASPNSELFVLRESSIRTAKDLEGRTLGVVSLHDLQTLSARALIEQAGGDSAKVKFVELPQSTMLEAVTAKRVDGIVAYEPFRTADEASGALRSLGAPFSAISRDMMYTGWVALAPWIAANRPAAAAFARVIRQATDYTNPHFYDLIPLMASVAKLAPETLQKLHRVRDATTLSPAFIQPVIDVAARFKEIPSAFPAQEIIASGL
jgi:NitT/TauT family transport system substrate-binding protein